MKSTTRGSVAAIVACVASAAGAGPAAALSAPVTLPLESVETALPVSAPALRTGVPVPVPHAPEAPRHVTGSLLPTGLLPRVPLTGEVPVTALEVPLEDPLTDRPVGVLGAAAGAPDLALSTPGASLGAPLSAPRPELSGWPEPVLPEVAVLAPALSGTPAADVLLG
jgi:hypothetical protein